MSTRDSLVKIAGRILHQMILLQKRREEIGLDQGDHLLNLKMFTGLGLALAFVFEEYQLVVHGRIVDASKMKPMEVMKWAMELRGVNTKDLPTI
jgi:hypothetical protein